MKKNTILMAVLVILVVLYLSTNYFKKNSSASFDPQIVKLDSSKVGKITIYPPAKEKEEPIVLSRSSGQWEVAQGKIVSKADPSKLRSALGQLLDVEAQRLVAKTKDKWPNYELGDSLARKVLIEEKGGGTTTALYFGKTSYGQVAAPAYGRGATAGSTYFRLNDDPETFALENGLPNTFSRPFNSWRNPEFLKLDKEQLKELEFNDVDGEAFVLRKVDSVWSIADTKADASKVSQYLNSLERQNSSQFVDGFSPNDKSLHTLTIRGQEMDEVVVRAYAMAEENKFVLNSSQHPEVFVESDSVGLFKRLFVDRDYFQPNKDE